MQKKVAFFVTGLASGGLENYLLRFLKFSEGKIKPFVVCKSGKFGDLEDEYRSIKDVELIKLKIGYFNILSLLVLSAFFKKNEIDTICDFTGNFAGLPIWVASFSGVNNRIAFYRGSTNHFEETFFRLKYNRFVQWLVMKYATNILTNSKAAMRFFFSNEYLKDGKYNVIYNGIDIASFLDSADRKVSKRELGLPENAFIIGHTGRYNKAKNHITIAHVANELCHQYDDIYFVLCGKNTEIFNREIVNKFPGLKDKLISLGYRRDVSDILRVFDVYFFPSITEGQPNALVEAMIVGLPIVASDIEPIKETVPPKIYSFLCASDDVSGFVNILKECYLSKNFRNRLICSDWAISNFNADSLFNSFLEKL